MKTIEGRKRLGPRMLILLIGVITLSTLVNSINLVQAEVHYDNWSSWKYLTLGAGQSYAPEVGVDGRFNVAGRRYLGIQKQIVILSGNGNNLIDELHWCQSTGPGEMWLGKTTWQWGGIVWDHFTNAGTGGSIYFKYRWQVYWEDI